MTKRQRLASYEYALKRIKDMSLGMVGICYHLRAYSSKYRIISFEEWFHWHLDRNYPEMWKSRPKGMSYHDVWWTLDKKGNEKRIKFLEKLIKEMSVTGNT